MKSKITFILFFFCMLLCFVLPQSQADNSSFPGLMTFLETEYSSPFQMAGKVKEISKSRLIFTKTDTSLKKSRILWVCEHKPEIAPALQSRVAWIKVEAIYKNMVIAKVLQCGKKAIQPKDIVITPPPPMIHIYTNIKAKQSNKAYQNLINALLSKDMQVKEIFEDTFNQPPGDSDLLLCLEWESGQLTCQCTMARENRLLFSEAMDYPETIETLYASGHRLQQSKKKVSSAFHDTAPGMESTITTLPATASAPGKNPLPATDPTPASIPAAAHVPFPANMPGTALASANVKVFATTPGEQSIDSNFQKAKTPDQTEFHRLSKLYNRIVACDLDADGSQELALLGNNEIALYRFEQNNMIPVASYQFSDKNLIPIHLHSADIDKIPGDELLVTLCKELTDFDTKDSEPCSIILSLKNRMLKPLTANIPYYLRTIQERRGVTVALAQKKGEYEQFSGPIMELRWDAEKNRITTEKLYGPAMGIYSIYQFNLKPGNDQRVLIIEPDATLHGYFAPEERLEATGSRNYGNFKELAYPLKLDNFKIVGGFDKETYKEIYTPRRFVQMPLFDSQSFTIYKERKGQTGIIDRAVQMAWKKSMGKDQVTGLKWIGQQIVETWQSKKISKNILDFTFIENPQRILVLYREENGCAVETL